MTRGQSHDGRTAYQPASEVPRQIHDYVRTLALGKDATLGVKQPGQLLRFFLHTAFTAEAATSRPADDTWPTTIFRSSSTSHLSRTTSATLMPGWLIAVF